MSKSFIQPATYLVGIGAAAIAYVLTPISAAVDSTVVATVATVIGAISIVSGITLYSVAKTRELHNRNSETNLSNRSLAERTGQARDEFPSQESYKNISYFFNTVAGIAETTGAYFLASQDPSNESDGGNNIDNLWIGGASLAAGVAVTGVTHVVCNSNLAERRERLKEEERGLLERHIDNLESENNRLRGELRSVEQDLEQTIRERDAQIARKDENIRSLKEKLQSLEQTIREHDAQIVIKEENIILLKEELKSSNGRIEKFEDELDRERDSKMHLS